MRVPLLDLKRQYETIKKEIDAAVRRVLESGQFILGPEVEAFEQEMAEYCGVKHAIGVASGTDALLLSLRALDVGPGNGVIVPSFTFFATAGAVVNAGAELVFVDIDPKTYNLDPRELKRLLTHDSGLRTAVKAVIPVHLYGQMADMDEIMAIAKEYDIAVVEDAAQAIGATYSSKRFENHELRTTHHELRTLNSELHKPNEPHEPNKLHSKAGTIGDLGCFSFFPTKNLGAYGDGGMVIASNDGLAEKIRLLRVHGSKPKYFHHLVGTNSRLDSLQAAILQVKLPRLDRWSQARQQCAERYNKLLRELDSVELPFVHPSSTHVYHQYTIRINDGQRDELRSYLREQGIGTGVYYPLPLHLQECFKDLGYQEGDFPEAEQASREVLSLPMFPELTEEEQLRVVSAIEEFFQEK